MNSRYRYGSVVGVILAMAPAGALAMAGFLDPTFSEGGKALVRFDPGGVCDFSNAGVAQQSDGGIIVVGTVVENGLDSDLSVARLYPDGSIDSAFGVGGKVRIPFNLGGYNIDIARAVALQPDQKIVVAGSAQLAADDFDFAVVRLNRDGSLDPSFAGVGKTIVYFDLGTNLADHGNSVAVQPDGKIVVAGYASSQPNSGWVIAVARLGADGFPDESFGQGGKTTVGFDLGTETHVVGSDMAIQRDGKIVIVGSAYGSDSPLVLAAVRLLEDGTLDGGFGEGGRVMVPFGSGPAYAGAANSVAIQPDGKIILAGDAQTGSFLEPNSDFLIARLQPDGAIDTSFGADGKVFVPFDLGGVDFSSDWADDVVIQPDRKIVVAGTVQRGERDRGYGVARLLDDGSLDPVFGDNAGLAVVDFDLGGPGLDNVDLGYALVLQADHKMVVAGVVDDGVDHSAMGVARLLTELIHLDGFESGATSGWTETVPPAWCTITFDDAFGMYGHGSDPEWFYGVHGVHPDNTNGFGVVGGMGNGDPGDWQLEGTNGSAAWGLWAGYHAIGFETPVTDVSLDMLRGHDDLTITVNASFEGGHVGSQTLSLSGPFDFKTAVFPGPIDTITWDAPCCYGMDNIVYTGNLECP